MAAVSADLHLLLLVRAEATEGTTLMAEGHHGGLEPGASMLGDNGGPFRSASSKGSV